MAFIAWRDNTFELPLPALLGLGAASDLSLQGAPKRTSNNRSSTISIYAYMT
jgi:hypothetical protein